MPGTLFFFFLFQEDDWICSVKWFWTFFTARKSDLPENTEYLSDSLETRLNSSSHLWHRNERTEKVGGLQKRKEERKKKLYLE